MAEQPPHELIFLAPGWRYGPPDRSSGFVCHSTDAQPSQPNIPFGCYAEQDGKYFFCQSEEERRENEEKYMQGLLTYKEIPVVRTSKHVEIVYKDGSMQKLRDHFKGVENLDYTAMAEALAVEERKTQEQLLSQIVAGVQESVIDYDKLVGAFDRHIDGAGSAVEWGYSTYFSFGFVIVVGCYMLWLAFTEYMSSRRVPSSKKAKKKKNEPKEHDDEGWQKEIDAARKRMEEKEERKKEREEWENKQEGFLHGYGLFSRTNNCWNEGAPWAQGIKDATGKATGHTQTRDGGEKTTTKPVESIEKPSASQVMKDIPTFSEYVEAKEPSPTPAAQAKPFPPLSDSEQPIPDHSSTSTNDWSAFKDPTERKEVQKMFSEAALQMIDWAQKCTGATRERLRSEKGVPELSNLVDHLTAEGKKKRGKTEEGRDGSTHGLEKVYEEALEKGYKGNGEHFAEGPIKEEVTEEKAGVDELPATEAKLATFRSALPSPSNGQGKNQWKMDVPPMPSKTRTPIRLEPADGIREETAYIAASRRSDRSVEARMEAAERASEIHFRRTGRRLKVDEEIVLNEKILYEEDDEVIPPTAQPSNMLDDATTPVGNKRKDDAPHEKTDFSCSPPTTPPSVFVQRTHEENQELAYIAASRRSDRFMEARLESARRASELHFKRTGRRLKVDEKAVRRRDLYEEEDDGPSTSEENKSKEEIAKGKKDIPPTPSATAEAIQAERSKQECAYLAASCRMDRSLEERLESARRACEVHDKRTGRRARVGVVVSGGMGEERGGLKGGTPGVGSAATISPLTEGQDDVVQGKTEGQQSVATPGVIRRERTHEENQERAYIAASRRSDRSLEARLESARRASEMHFQRTGRRFVVNERIVGDGGVYVKEEEQVVPSVVPSRGRELFMLGDDVTMPFGNGRKDGGSEEEKQAVSGAKILKTVRGERTHEENQERAYIAASRRTDRSLEARMESANRASDMHYERTGRHLRVRGEDIVSGKMYEEEAQIQGSEASCVGSAGSTTSGTKSRIESVQEKTEVVASEGLTLGGERERTHEENQERAYICSSRRSDRSMEARLESARRATEIHFKRTGRCLKVNEEAVLGVDMYEEEDIAPVESGDASIPAATPMTTVEVTHEERQERAYLAASKRSDRFLVARIESARRASETHFRRTGRRLKVNEKAVLSKDIYEEEDAAGSAPTMDRTGSITADATSNSDVKPGHCCKYWRACAKTGVCFKVQQEEADAQLRRDISDVLDKALPAFKALPPLSTPEAETATSSNAEAAQSFLPHSSPVAAIDEVNRQTSPPEFNTRLVHYCIQHFAHDVNALIKALSEAAKQKNGDDWNGSRGFNERLVTYLVKHFGGVEKAKDAVLGESGKGLEREEKVMDGEKGVERLREEVSGLEREKKIVDGQVGALREEVEALEEMKRAHGLE